MKFHYLLPLALLACDENVDEDFVLSHGAVRAEVQCVKDGWTCLPPYDCGFKYKTSLFHDGSYLTSVVAYSISPYEQHTVTNFSSRGQYSYIGNVEIPNMSFNCESKVEKTFYIEDGYLKVDSQADTQPPCATATVFTLPLDDSDCSGFNLEAFGVE